MAGFEERFINYVVIYLASCVCVNTYGHIYTSKHIIYNINHLISRFMRPAPGVLWTRHRLAFDKFQPVN